MTCVEIEPYSHKKWTLTNSDCSSFLGSNRSQFPLGQLDLNENDRGAHLALHIGLCDSP